jgi:hypothetical protein
MNRQKYIHAFVLRESVRPLVATARSVSMSYCHSKASLYDKQVESGGRVCISDNSVNSKSH